MIDWWVISSILAGLGTAYGANAYNKKDAKELREKAEKLLADSGFKEAETKWTTQVEELQKKLTQTDEDKQKAEEAKAKLEAMIQELQGNIQARRDDTQKQLQDITSPVESQYNMATPYDFGRALRHVDTALRARGIVIGPALQDLFTRIATRSQPFERGTISQLHERATAAYAKDTAPPSGKGRRGRGKKRGGVVTPVTVETPAAPEAPAAPPEAPTAAPEGPTAAPEGPPEAPTAPTLEAPPAAPVAPIPEAPPAVTVVPLPPVAGTPPPFPTLEEFRAMWEQAFADIARTPGMLPPMMGPPPMMGMPPGVPPPPMMGPPPIVPAPPPSKKDKEAQKAASALLEKIQRASDAAVKEVAPYKEHATTLAADAKQKADEAYTMLTTVFTDINALITQLSSQEVRETNWSALKQSGADLNARLATAVKAYKDAVGSLPSGFLSFFKKKPAPAPVAPAGPITTHIGILERGPKTLAKMTAMIKALDTTFAQLGAKLKVIPTPELFRGGCGVKTVAEDTSDLLEKLRTLLKRHQKTYETAFAMYTKETKDTPLYDSSFPDNVEADIEKTASIDAAAAELATKADLLAARVYSLKTQKGGAKVFEKALTAAQSLKMEEYAFRALGSRVQSVLDDAKTMIDLIDTTIRADNQLKTKEDRDAEKRSCPLQVEALKKTLPSATPKLVSPFEMPETGEAMVQNPLFSARPARKSAEAAPPEAPAVVRGDFVTNKKLIDAVKAAWNYRFEQMRDDDTVGPRSKDPKVTAALKEGADPNARDPYGNTALMWAAIMGEDPSLEQLLDAGASVNLQDEEGLTALHHAAKRGHMVTVQVLLKRGADPTIKTKEGKTPSMMTFNSFIRNLLEEAESAGKPVDQQGIAATLGLPAQPPTGPELELAPLPAAPAAPAAPAVPPLEVEPPAGDIPVMVGDPPLPPQLAQLAPLVPDDAANVSQRLLPTTKRPTKGSWWHENATAVRDLVGAWYDKWKRLPKEEKKASKNEAEAAQQALQLSAFGSDQVVQLGGDSLEKEIEAELKALEGGVRKRTFKRRRGEKQNGRRVSRRRKDRANRSHSHTR